MTREIHESWEEVFEGASDELETIWSFIEGDVVPTEDKVFEAFRITDLNRIKVVIMGGDPNPTGLAFSLDRDAPITKAVAGIYEELRRTVPGFVTPTHGDLSCWADQGVFLLSSALTASKGSNNSYWHLFLYAVTHAILKANPNVVFLTWGSKAKETLNAMSLGGNINRLDALYPTERGFVGCDHFDKISRHLSNLRSKKGAVPGFKLDPIDWNIV